ncbi:MAG TPA: Rieske (2Fe-2S) protein [Candidatus Acidoferrales bacterium]|nr:Rieske (2Fe-2S) protein [Candidatus Acidoferrales bacterium]
MDGPGNEKISRRTFLDYLLGLGVIAWLGSVLYPIIAYFRVPEQTEATPTSVTAGSVKDLKPNQGKVFRFGNEPAILINTPDGKLEAFSAVCTHLQCTVQYRPDMGKIFCACHGGVYDLNGRNVAGPPPRPLQEYKVAVKGDDVIVTKS